MFLKSVCLYLFWHWPSQHMTHFVMSFEICQIIIIGIGYNMSPCSHSWGYYPGTLSCSQVTATHVKIGHPQIPSTGPQSPHELQWLDFKIGYQKSGSSNGHYGNIPRWFGNSEWLFHAAQSTFTSSTDPQTDVEYTSIWHISDRSLSVQHRSNRPWKIPSFFLPYFINNENS